MKSALAVPLLGISASPAAVIDAVPAEREGKGDGATAFSDLREGVVGETSVWLADGRGIPIEELVGSTRKVFAMAPDGRIVTAKAERIWSQGIRPVWWVSFASGRSLTVTPGHRFYTERGWQALVDIRVGERLRVLTSGMDTEETTELFWDPIEENRSAGEAEVFDITVLEPESWFAGGVVSQNSGAIDGMRR